MNFTFTFFATLIFSSMVSAQSYYLLTGTYTNGDSKGIYVNRFDAGTGKISPVSIAAGIENPSYLAVSANGKFVYAVNENGGAKPGGVSSFAFNSKTGELTFLNYQPTSGDHPCYIATDKTGKWVFTGNYTGGNISAFPVLRDGSLGKLSQLVNHEGKGATPRQDKPHVHSTNFTPDQKFLLVPDLGLDKIMIYAFDASAKKPLKPAKIPSFSVNNGNGPRHLSFHPALPYVYVIEELSGTVTAFTYNGINFSSIQNISSHPENFNGSKGSADIHVSPDGKFVYATNRGDANSMAIFSIDQSTGKLTLKDSVSTMGVHPRNFTIEPTGKFVLIANRDSNNIVVFARDASSGLLTQQGEPFEVPNPVFLGLVPVTN